MKQTTLQDALRLIRSENVGPITYHQLVQRFGSAQEALHWVPELALRGGHPSKIRLCTIEDAQQEIEQHHAKGFQLITIDDDDYPALLKHLDDAPPVLSVYGDTSRLNTASPYFGIVGARNASLNSLQYTQKIANALGQQGWQIVSGLARGIDTYAHQGSLDTGTIAVIASGINVIYPPENEKLYHTIGEKGVVISEMPFDTAPQATLFPRRNRLISGLSWGILVVEAALRSGSLITARFALEQGREVMALPGSPLDTRCRGTNQLLKNGALLVENVQDIVDCLQHQQAARLSSVTEPAFRLIYTVPEALLDTGVYQRKQAEILALLTPHPTAINDLIRHVNLPASIVLSIILELELAGRVQRQPSNTITLTLNGN